MKLSECKPFDESFTFISHENEVSVFNTSALARHLVDIKFPTEMVDLNDELANIIIRNNGIEWSHVKRLKPDCLKRPVIFIELGDETHLLVDGSHRCTYASKIAFRTEILSWVVRKEIWKPFVVELPPELDLHKYVKNSTGKVFPHDVKLVVGRY